MTAPRPVLRLLIVDDHPLVRIGLRAAIMAAFPQAVLEEAQSIAEALACLRAADIDLILLDLALPDSRGHEGLAVLRAAAPGLPVVVLTGAADDDVRGACLAAGASAVVFKSNGPREVIEAIGRLVDAAPMDGATRPGLTPRETDILILCAKGLQNKQIGRSLGISENTVRAHLASVFRRFGLASRGDVQALLERTGVL
ncbi:response regulator transcription factor [Alsobacter sp. SYSU M60028]|uniref:Response regulator transcription factor n=1 Tax=Alsobacter ponti TaxID=2962936 RepID=A0ABT1LEG4_9HYPH|nr:response regulator transcription factor [Alsobacter ponti]MCP8939506.1 response regulator transcription factor [Alsobacter ponti]